MQIMVHTRCIQSTLYVGTLTSSVTNEHIVVRAGLACYNDDASICVDELMSVT